MALAHPQSPSNSTIHRERGQKRSTQRQAIEIKSLTVRTMNEKNLLPNGEAQAECKTMIWDWIIGMINARKNPMEPTEGQGILNWIQRGHSQAHPEKKSIN